MHWRLPALLLTATLVVGCAQPAPPPATETAPSPRETLQVTDSAFGRLLAPASLRPEQRRAWLERIERTSATLAGAELGPLDDDWDGVIVVELPATQRDYTVLAGGGSDQAAAVTRCDGEESPITVNPAVEAAAEEYLDALLLHEAVHAATGSACRPTPLWIEEGLAEWLTVQHSATAERENREWLDHRLAAAGLPSGLPQDSAFRGSAAELSGAYALAVAAVATAVEHLGREAAMAYFAAPDDRTTELIADWYLSRLRERPVPAPASANAPR